MHVSSSPDPVAGMLACSDNMFVHNNSKHGRKSRKVESAYGECLLLLIIKTLSSKMLFSIRDVDLSSGSWQKLPVCCMNFTTYDALET